jgi:hypothetical protein
VTYSTPPRSSAPSASQLALSSTEAAPSTNPLNHSPASIYTNPTLKPIPIMVKAGTYSFTASTISHPTSQPSAYQSTFPPRHAKPNPLSRCLGALQRRSGGVPAWLYPLPPSCTLQSRKTGNAAASVHSPALPPHPALHSLVYILSASTSRQPMPRTAVRYPQGGALVAAGWGEADGHG